LEGQVAFCQTSIVGKGSYLIFLWLLHRTGT